MERIVGSGYIWECVEPCVGEQARKESERTPNKVIPCPHPLCQTEYLNGGKLIANDVIDANKEDIVIKAE